MYTFAHPIEDALEKITHSICTLEFEDQRPFYDWILDRLIDNGLLSKPQPRQYEFARLNLTYAVLSKRKLIELVENKHVTGSVRPNIRLQLDRPRITGGIVLGRINFLRGADALLGFTSFCVRFAECRGCDIRA
jgi:glutamyl/glutaminyl-tRNA synthetase